MGDAMRYLRKASTGRVFDWNRYLAAEPDMQEFESSKPPPDVIPDLVAFLIQQRPAPQAAPQHKAAGSRK